MLTKNQIITLIICIVIAMIVALFLVFKESFIYSGKEIKEIREDFPQTSPMNVLYSDASGNLSSTSDLGINNLTTTGNAQIGGNLSVLRKRLTFSSADDPNHAIYNNGFNNDGQGAWDGMKMNVYAGLDVRTGNANGATPKTMLSIRDGSVTTTGSLSAGSVSTGTGTLNAGTTTVGSLTSSSFTTGSINQSGGKIYSKADIGDKSDGHEFRHTNQSQGVGIGYNSIYATGWNDNQDLNILSKGTGKVFINDRNLLSDIDNASTRIDNASTRIDNALSSINSINALRGSNGNGAWIKLGDNYAIQYGISPKPCWDCGYTVTFPIAFAEPPILYSVRSTTDTHTTISGGYPNRTHISGDSWYNGSADKPTVRWIAYGKI